MIAAPMRVVVAELDRLPSVSGIAATGGKRYHGAWVLVTHHGRPVGELVVEFAPQGPLTIRPPGAVQVDAWPGTHPMTAGGNPVRGSAGILTGSDLAGSCAPPGRLPFVTVVLPTVFGRATLLRRAIAALAALDYPEFEVLIVDNRREVDTPVPDLGPAGADSRVRLVRTDRPGISSARNTGIARARGEIIAFTDDDVMVDSGWLRALTGRLMAEPDADCVTGLVLPAELETAEQLWFECHGGGPARRYHAGLYHVAARELTGLRPWDRRRFEVCDRYGANPGSTRSLYQLGDFGTGANMAFWTDALAELDGFDEALGTGTPARGGEDIALFVRLLFSGRCLAFEPAAFVFHAHRRTYPELRRQVIGYGRGLTAALVGVIRYDLWHVFGLLRVAVPAIMVWAGRPRKSIRDRAPDRRLSPLRNWVPDRRQAPSCLPAGDLTRARVLGLLQGPVAYLWSRHRMRR